MSSEEEEFQGDESSEEEFQGDEDFEEEEDVLEADEESDDDDAPLATLKKKKSKAIPESDDDESSDDDIPLAALKSPPKKKKAAPKKKKAVPKKKATKAKAAKPTKKTTKTKKKDASSTNGSFRSASAALYGSNCQKGQLIQTLLCRWWYAITWPENIPSEPPKHYDSLDGMPGVFVCTSGGDVGRIMDMRDMTKCPNFKNMAKKTSAELKDLVVTALKAQKEALVAAEGAGTDTEKELNGKIKWAEKLNPDKADKEAVKVLKAAKLSLST